MRREACAPHPGASRLSLSPHAGRGVFRATPSPRLRGESGAKRRMRGAILTLLLLANVASAATMRDVKDPAKIKEVFPKTAKLRVVNVWATWCAPCVAEMPELRAIDAAFGPEVAMIGVSADDSVPDADRAQVAGFLDKQKIPYPNVYYRGTVDDLMTFYRFEGTIPITLVFDRNGKELWRHDGPVRSADAIAQIKKLLRRMQ